MRDAVQSKNKDPNKINPLSTVDLVIDHSVMVDEYASGKSFTKNVEREFSRNGERYSFLKWGQKAFDNFRVVPPGTGICHQVNLEYLSKVVWTSKSGEGLEYNRILENDSAHLESRFDRRQNLPLESLRLGRENSEDVRRLDHCESPTILSMEPIRIGRDSPPFKLYKNRKRFSRVLILEFVSTIGASIKVREESSIILMAAVG